MNHLSTWLSVCFAAHLLEEPCPQASEQSSCLSSGNRRRVDRSQEHPPPGIDRDDDGDRDDGKDGDDGDDGDDGEDGDDCDDGEDWWWFYCFKSLSVETKLCKSQKPGNPRTAAF